MTLPIVSYGNPVLQQPAKEVKESHPKLRRLVEQMWQTMKAANGVGLAAPQVNEPYRLFVTETFSGHEDESAGNVFINPKIENYSGLRKVEIEGCLSIPGLQVGVIRAEHIRIRYQTLQLEWKEQGFSGLPARIIQHEYDHLQGILMTDRISKDRQKSVRSFLQQIAKGEVKTKYQMVS